MLSFMLPAFVRVLSLARHWYCLHVYIQLLAVCGRHFLILCWKSSLLLCWKIFSTRGHKPSLFWFRFLNLGLVLPQEDGSSDDIGFLTSQWRLVCDRIFVLCRPLSFDIPTICFFSSKRDTCACVDGPLFSFLIVILKRNARWNGIGATFVWSTGAQEAVCAASQGSRKWKCK